MHVGFDFRMKRISKLILSAMLLAAAQSSMAADVVDLGTVQSSADFGANAAPAQAPTQGSLVATEPQSIMNQQYIQQNASAASNYTDIVTVAPAVQSVNPNGPGLMETQSMTMRGFTDGQFNVTFDGIPWSDSNDFTHHSTSYFMPQDIGEIVVDRGPGDASTVGDATFGGTIAVHSKNPTTQPGFTPYASFGSWNTRMWGAEFDTGNLQNYGDANMYVRYSQLSSDGFLTNSGINRGNLFIKYYKPISADTVMTVVAMKGQLHQNVPVAMSNADRAALGYNAGLNNNPQSMDYYGYNYDNINTDMEYVDLTSQMGDWTVVNKLYTYGYTHYGFNGDSPTDWAPGQNPGLALVTTAGGTAGVGGTNDVLGQQMYMLYRSWGDVLHTSKPMGSGTLDVGAWVDRQTNSRMERNVDYTLNGALVSTSNQPTGYTRLMDDTLTTVQPYAQYEWNVTDALTVTPGVKYTSFSRDLKAPINQTKPTTPYYGSATWTKALPSLVGHYAISPNWSAYAQYAQGFLAPNLNVFYQTVAPDLSTMKPTETNNLQVGSTWKTQALTVSADAYSIKSKNWMQPIVGPTQTVYTDAGNVNFNGAEAEATVAVGGGFNLYGNYASINYSIQDPASFASAKSGGGGCGPNGDKLCDVPDSTSAAGVLYNHGPAYASLIAKTVGKRYSDVVQMAAYTVANFNVGYTIASGSHNKLKIGFQVNNLFDKQGNYMATGQNANGDETYFVIPSRSYQVSLTGTL
jgi:iron complex outermembrane recepter protein